MPECAHVAFVIPHTDVTGEMDFHRFLPDHVVHVQRMWLGDVSKEAEQKMVAEELPAALRYLKGVAPYKCAVFGCTSASAVNGVDGMFAMQELMSRELGCPAISVMGAVLHEIRQRNAKSVAVFTPYTDEVNAFVRQTMETFGVSVASICGMGLILDADIAALSPEQISDFVYANRDNVPDEADLCFFSCTNVRSAEIRQELSDLIGKTFITSNQCVIDYVRNLP